MKCLVTICSKNKDINEDLIPAHLRYLAPHITQIYKKSQDLGVPLYILSGKYCLIKSEDPIPFYDYYLESSHVEELTQIVSDQIKKEGITDIDFYIEEKETWKPYITALEQASVVSGIILHKEKLFPSISEIKMR